MARIDAELLTRLPLSEIERVVFYKRDELTTDLVCCDVRVAGKVWTFHEALAGWDLLIEHLNGLRGFQPASLAAMAQPPFELSETVAFCR
jgi:hypothetical protein